MAKPTALSFEALSKPQITPQAATPPRQAIVASVEPPKPAKVDHVPLQIRVPRLDARAIKVAAAERDMQISEFMLACFNAYMKKP